MLPFLIRPSRHLALLTFLVTVAAVVLGSRDARAHSAGIDSSQFQPIFSNGCNNCHQTQPPTALAPSVALSASATTATVAAPVTLTFVVTSQNPTVQIAAGFNIESSQPGTFAPVGGDTSTRSIANAVTQQSEATHTAPKNNDVSNKATFIVLWTPLAGTSGAVTFTAWGNSVNKSGNNVGDRAASTTLDITVCTSVFYLDADADGFGDPAHPVTACTAPSGYVANNTDCNDGSSAIHPGATEVCNGVDDNCAGGIDEGVTNTYHRDMDGDGYGNPSAPTTACTAPAGYVADNTDCNDENASIHPGATEVCNGVDDNCNGVPDDGLAMTTFYRDADGDGYGSPTVTKMACSLAVAGAGYVTNNTDCDDANANVSPAAPEICGNQKDDNCNGIVDTDAPAISTFYKDADGDGFGAAASGTMMACAPPAGYVSNNTDCDDAAPSIHPGATEICNGHDDNCDGNTDEGLGTLSCGDGSCRTTVVACVAGVTQVCTPVCPEAGADAANESGGAFRDAGVDVARDGLVSSDVVVAAPDVAPGDAVSPIPTDAAADTSAPPAGGNRDDASLHPDAPGSPSESDAKLDARTPDAAAVPGATEDDGAPTNSGCSCRTAHRSSHEIAGSWAAALFVTACATGRRRRVNRKRRR